VVGVELQLELPELEHEELLEVLVSVFAFMQVKITTSAGVFSVLVPPVPGSEVEGKSKAITLLLNKVNKAALLKEKNIFVFIFYLLKIVKLIKNKHRKRFLLFTR
jgi:hypothetical protein